MRLPLRLLIPARFRRPAPPARALPAAPPPQPRLPPPARTPGPVPLAIDWPGEDVDLSDLDRTELVPFEQLERRRAEARTEQLEWLRAQDRVSR